MELKQGRELEAFNSMYRELDGMYHEIARKLELSDSVFLVLYALVEFGDGCLQNDIVKYYFISKQTVHSAVKVLEGKGFLSLRNGKGRDMHLDLTPAGRRLAEEKMAPVLALENSVFAEMQPEESQALLALTRKYVSLFREKTAHFPASGEGGDSQ